MMKNNFWITICSAYSLLSLICCELTQGPDDVLVKVGTTATLPCSTNLSVPVQWEFKRYGAFPNEPWALVYFGYPTSHITARYRNKNKYNVTVDSQVNDYNLTIINVQTDDAGTYRCIDDYGFGSHKHDEGIPHHEYRAEVITIEQNLTCYQSINETQTNTTKLEVSERDVIRMGCIFNYRGKLSPELIWSYKAGSNNFQVFPLSLTRDREQDSFASIMSDIEINATEMASGTYFRCNLTTTINDVDRTLAQNLSEIFWTSDIIYIKKGLSDENESSKDLDETVEQCDDEVSKDDPRAEEETSLMTSDIGLNEAEVEIVTLRNDTVFPDDIVPDEEENDIGNSVNIQVTWTEAFATHQIDDFQQEDDFDDHTALTTLYALDSLFITKVTIYLVHWSTYNVDIIGAIKISYSNGVTVEHGTIGDKPESLKCFDLGTDEKITAVKIRAGWAIDSLQFKTNKNIRYGPYGGGGGDPDKLRGHTLSAYLAFMKGKVMRIKGENATAIRHLQFGFVSSEVESGEASALYDSSSCSSGFDNDSLFSDYGDISATENLEIEWSDALALDAVKNLEFVKDFDDSIAFSDDCSTDQFLITSVTLYLTWWNNRDVIGAIKIDYNNGRILEHGTIGDRPESKKTFTLDEDERITKVIAKSGLLVDSLRFITSKKRLFGPYGGNGGGPVKTKGHSSSSYLGFIKGSVMKFNSQTVIKHLQFGWVSARAKQKSIIEDDIID